MTPESTLTVRSSAELLAAVPYLLGFHPADSLVVVAVRGRRVLFAGRYDLPPIDHAGELALHLATVVAQQGVNSTTLIGYGEATRVTPAVIEATRAVERAGVTVLDALRVTDGQYWSYFCDDPACCPAPCPPVDSAVAAAATYAGQVALPDREALVAQIAPVTGAQRTKMAAATARARVRLTELFGTDRLDGGFAVRLHRAGRRAVRDAERRYHSGRHLTDDEVAWLGLTLVDTAVRDYAWERQGPEEWQVALWTDVLRRVEPGYVPAPAVLLSFAAWRNGLGTLARVAVDRALAHDPEYRVAQGLEELLNLGVSPAMLRDWPDRTPVGKAAGRGSETRRRSETRRQGATRRGRKSGRRSS